MVRSQALTREQHQLKKEATMHKFFKLVLIAGLAVPAAVVSNSAEAGSRKVCTIPGTIYVAVVDGCVKHVTDPAVLGNSTYAETGKKVQVRQDYDPKCDGKPSGFMYDVDIVHADGTPGVGHVKCD
jgi:hypothetical protein